MIKENLEDNYDTVIDDQILVSLIKSIMKSLSNIESLEYPWVKLNVDQSISFFDEFKVNSDLALFEKDFIQNFLLKQVKLNNFKIIANNNLIEKIQHDNTGLNEYKVNISPDNLDSILKINYLYADRGTNSILKLCKNFSLKFGKIRLFPVYPLTDQFIKKQYLIRAAGCQMTEMATIQLLRIMKNTLDNIGELESNFYWVPKEVIDRLCIDKIDVITIINKILLDYSLLNNKIRFNGSEGCEAFIKEPEWFNNDENNDIEIVDINQLDLDFYMIYGNLTKEELQYCRSLEVSNLIFLKKIKEHLETKIINFYQDLDYIIKLENAIELVNKIFKNLELTFIDNKNSLNKLRL